MAYLCGYAIGYSFLYSVIIYKTMAKCYVCGKTSKVGRSVTFSGERNPRLFKANLHRVKAVLEDGTVKGYTFAPSV